MACKKDFDKAIKYLVLGVELGCASSISQLGKLYHQGVYYERDDKRAGELLLEAIMIGSVDAESYYFDDFIKYKESIKNIVKEASQKAAESLLAIAGGNGAQEKVGRNKKCPCGSGNKYKKCCENKAHLLRQKISDLADKHLTF